MQAPSTSPLHVGIDGTSWDNDRGFGRFTRELVTALAARDAGLRYTLLVDRPPERPVPEGVAVQSAATTRTLNESAVGEGSRSPAYLWQVGRAARRAGFDVFFFTSVYSYFPILARVPCVVCYHDTTAERLPELLFPTRLNHLLWRVKTALARLQTTRAMAVSQSTADDVESILGIPRERIDLVTEAADPVFRVLEDPAAARAARTRHGIPEDGTLLVYVGGINPHKNLLGLLEALPDVVVEHPDLHLAIVGSTTGEGFWDNVDEVRAFVAAHPPLPDRVHFTGYIDDEALVELLNGAAALVFPSLWEGFGLPAVEAMSCGVPVLASDCSSLPEVVGEAGLYFEPRDPRSIADCLRRFLGDAALRSRLADAALTRSSTFTWERAAELAEACFRRCHADATRRR
jgi:alpha-1,3-rhamnosyl/mannosyltransferase